MPPLLEICRRCAPELAKPPTSREASRVLLEGLCRAAARAHAHQRIQRRFATSAKQRPCKHWTATWQWRSIRLVPALERLAFDNIFDLILIDHPQKVMLAPFPYIFPFRAPGNISVKKILEFTLIGAFSTRHTIGTTARLENPHGWTPVHRRA